MSHSENSPSDVRRPRLDLVARLAAGIGHDFGNSMTAILGLVRLAGQAETKSDRSSALAGIEEAIEQVRELCRLLLALDGHSDSKKVPQDLGRVTGEALRLLERIVPASVVLVPRMPEEGELWADVDSVQIQRMILCLAASSVEAMPDGGRLEITLRGEAGPTEGDRLAILTVRDDGAGPRGTLRDREGEIESGLGLSSVHRTVERHGGSVESTVASGGETEVRVRLPACPPGGGRRRTDERPAVRGEGRRILVAEDDPDVRAVMATVLHRAGFTVEQVEDGQQALSAVEREPQRYAALVLSYDLPGMDGVTCYRAIQAHRPEIPTVFVSGISLPDEAVSLSARTAFARKPFGGADLLELVRSVLEAP